MTGQQDTKRSETIPFLLGGHDNRVEIKPVYTIPMMTM
jgi:hypothetical protein